MNNRIHSNFDDFFAYFEQQRNVNSLKFIRDFRDLIFHYHIDFMNVMKQFYERVKK